MMRCLYLLLCFFLWSNTIQAGSTYLDKNILVFGKGGYFQDIKVTASPDKDKSNAAITTNKGLFINGDYISITPATVPPKPAPYLITDNIQVTVNGNSKTDKSFLIGNLDKEYLFLKTDSIAAVASSNTWMKNGTVMVQNNDGDVGIARGANDAWGVYVVGRAVGSSGYEKRVGIGTNQPQKTLHVSGNVFTSGTIIGSIGINRDAQADASKYTTSATLTDYVIAEETFSIPLVTHNVYLMGLVNAINYYTHEAETWIDIYEVAGGSSPVYTSRKGKREFSHLTWPSLGDILALGVMDNAEAGKTYTAKLKTSKTRIYPNDNTAFLKVWVLPAEPYSFAYNSGSPPSNISKAPAAAPAGGFSGTFLTKNHLNFENGARIIDTNDTLYLLRKDGYSDFSAPRIDAEKIKLQNSLEIFTARNNSATPTYNFIIGESDYPQVTTGKRLSIGVAFDNNGEVSHNIRADHGANPNTLTLSGNWNFSNNGLFVKAGGVQHKGTVGINKEPDVYNTSTDIVLDVNGDLLYTGEITGGYARSGTLLLGSDVTYTGTSYSPVYSTSFTLPAGNRWRIFAISQASIYVKFDKDNVNASGSAGDPDFVVDMVLEINGVKSKTSQYKFDRRLPWNNTSQATYDQRYSHVTRYNEGNATTATLTNVQYIDLDPGVIPAKILWKGSKSGVPMHCMAGGVMGASDTTGKYPHEKEFQGASISIIAVPIP